MYALRSAADGRGEPGKLGPRTELRNREPVVEIQIVLSESPFVTEGAPDRAGAPRGEGIPAGRNRVLRLIRENGLPAPVRRGHLRGDRSHGSDPDGSARLP